MLSTLGQIWEADDVGEEVTSAPPPGEKN